MRSRRASDSTTPPCGTPPPTRPVLPPCGTTGTPAAAQARTTAATSAVVRGRTAARASPRKTCRGSVEQGSKIRRRRRDMAFSDGGAQPLDQVRRGAWRFMPLHRGSGPEPQGRRLGRRQRAPPPAIGRDAARFDLPLLGDLRPTAATNTAAPPTRRDDLPPRRNPRRASPRKGAGSSRRARAPRPRRGLPRAA